MYIYIHVYTYIYIYMYVYIYVYTYVYIYIYIYIYIYLYIYMYIYIYRRVGFGVRFCVETDWEGEINRERVCVWAYCLCQVTMNQYLINRCGVNMRPVVYAHTHKNTYTFTYEHVFACTQIMGQQGLFDVYAYTNTYKQIYMAVYICAQIYMHICIFVYIDRYTQKIPASPLTYIKVYIQL